MSTLNFLVSSARQGIILWGLARPPTLFINYEKAKKNFLITGVEKKIFFS